MPTYAIVLIIIAVVISLIIGAVIINGHMEKRRDPHGPVMMKKRQNIADRVKAVEQRSKELGIRTVDTPVGDEFQNTLFECRSLLRDGRRGMEKLSMLTDKLEILMADIEKQHA